MLSPSVTVQPLFQGIKCNQILFLLTNVFICRLGLDPESPLTPAAPLELRFADARLALGMIESVSASHLEGVAEAGPCGVGLGGGGRRLLGLNY